MESSQITPLEKSHDFEQNLRNLVKVFKQPYLSSSKKIETFKKINKEVFDFCKTLNGFGVLSEDFLDSAVAYHVNNHEHHFRFFNWWIKIERYIHNPYQYPLEKELNSIFENDYLGDKTVICSPLFIRNIYLSNNPALIKLFQQFLPTPPPEVFYGYKMPDEIANEECRKTESILRNRNNIDAKTIFQLQRHTRGKIRRKEELERITKITKKYGGTKRIFEQIYNNKNITMEEVSEDANTPYYPQKCDPILGERIVNAAKKVKLFNEIRTLTSEKSAPPIFDDGLNGRKTLERFNMRYKGAALNGCDLEDGDHNVICFGPGEIDEKCIQEDSLEIVLDVDKLQKDNPCIFYKQRDLGYALKRNRTVSFGKQDLVFSHTHSSELRIPTPSCIFFKIIAPWQGYAELPKYLFIAYDMEKMHQILTLNFFRFMDNLQTFSYNDVHSDEIIKQFYAEIAKLDDNELVKFLENLGKNFTDTAEFNFYGAHQIDFDSLKRIKFNNNILEMEFFIDEIRNGNLEELKNAKLNFPSIFKSYRFIDYLLSVTRDDTIQSELLSYRENCKLPFWLFAHEKGFSEKDNLEACHQQFLLAKRERRENKQIRKQQEKERKQQQENESKQVANNMPTFIEPQIHIPDSTKLIKKDDVINDINDDYSTEEVIFIILSLGMYAYFKNCIDRRETSLTTPTAILKLALAAVSIVVPVAQVIGLFTLFCRPANIVKTDVSDPALSPRKMCR